MIYKVRLWWYKLWCKWYDTRDIQGVLVSSFWKLKHPIIGPGYIFIPLNKRVNDLDLQVVKIRQLLREAIALRIKKRNKNKVKNYG